MHSICLIWNRLCLWFSIWKAICLFFFFIIFCAPQSRSSRYSSFHLSNVIAEKCFERIRIGCENESNLNFIFNAKHLLIHFNNKIIRFVDLFLLYKEMKERNDITNAKRQFNTHFLYLWYERIPKMAIYWVKLKQMLFNCKWEAKNHSLKHSPLLRFVLKYCVIQWKADNNKSDSGWGGQHYLANQIIKSV